jgi:hypothetical protein
MYKIIIAVSVISMVTACCMPEPAKKENRIPVIESVSYAKDSMATIDNEIVCNASDLDGDSLIYEWSSDGGQITASGSKAVWIAPDTMGNYKVGVTVKDGKRGEAISIAEIRVLNNSDGSSAPPVTLKMRLPSDEVVSENVTVKVGTITKVNCIVENLPGKKISYSWSTGGGRIKGKGIEDGTCTVVYWTAPVETKMHVLEVTARDLDGNEAKGSVTFDVFCCPRN